MFGDWRGANQLGTRTLEMAKVCGNGRGTEGALGDLKNVPRGTKSITEKSKGTESITEKLRGRGSAKCGKGRRAKQGFFWTCTGMKRLFNVQNGQDEIAKKKRGQLARPVRKWSKPGATDNDEDKWCGGYIRSLQKASLGFRTWCEYRRDRRDKGRWYY